MYCTKCGKEVNETEKFCSNCGDSLSQGNGASKSGANRQNVSKSTSNSVGKIGTILLIIGIVLIVLTIIFFISKGGLLGYDRWDYSYGDAKEVGIALAVISGVIFVTGLCMRIASPNTEK